MKKILSLVLVLTLVLSMGTVAMVASAYDSTTVFKFTTDKQTVEVGETFTLTITIDKLAEEAAAAMLEVYFDSDKVTASNLNVVFENSGWNSASECSIIDNRLHLEFLDNDAGTGVHTDAGSVTVTANFTAIAEGQVTFSAEENGEEIFSSESGDPMEYTQIPASVTIGSGGVEPVPEPTYFVVTFDVDGTTTDVDVEEGKSVDASDVPGFPPSAESVYAWDKDVTAPITAETVFTAVKSPRTYSITAVGATASATSVSYKTAVTVTAEDEKDGKAFSYFTKDGKVVSYDKVYKFLVYADTTVEAVYNGEASAEASAFIDTPYYTMKGDNVKMVSSFQVVLPAGVTVESYKIFRKTRTNEVVADAEALKATKASEPAAKFNAQGRLDYSVLSSKSSAKFVDIMFVATLSDGTVVESNVVSVGASLA